MSTWINPYLFFNGNAREAFTFYQSIFGGKLDLLDGKTFGLPEDQHDRIMHSHLKTEDGWTIMGADDEVEGDLNRANLTLGGTEKDVPTAQKWYDALAEGGERTFPLERQQWGDLYGQVKDKFGVTWAFNFGGGSNSENSEKPEPNTEVN